MRAGRGWETLKAANDDYYADMDRGMSRHPDQVLAALPFLKTPEKAVDTFVKGRNNWIVVDGRQRHALELPVGPHLRRARLPEDAVDARCARLRPQQGRVRPLEISRAGQRAVLRGGDGSGPDSGSACGWTDAGRGPDCPPDPFEDEQKYPGVRIGARGTSLNLTADKKQLGWPDTLPVGSYYGYATGSSGSGCFRTPISMRRRRRSGIPTTSTRTAATTRTRTWCGRIASACRAGSATSGPARSTRLQIRRTRSGRT